MRLAFIAIATTLSLSACDSDQDQKIKAMERHIQLTVQSDWRDGIPLDDLVDASLNCQKFQGLKGCKVIEHKMEDIATSLASCHANQRSTLCQVLIRVIGKHPIASLLPKANVLQLPDDPFYWALPTAAFEAQAENFDYRMETASWLWQKWGTYILSCVALLILSYGIWICWSEWGKAKKERTAALARQRAEHAEQKSIRRIREEQVRIEAEQQIKLAHEASIAVQQRLAAEELAELQAAAAVTKLAAEQAEATKLLEAAFAQPKPKRRKNVPSSK